MSRREKPRTLHEGFLRAVDHATSYPVLLTTLFADKASKTGHPLTSKERKRLEEHLGKAGTDVSETFVLRRKGPPDEHVTLTLDDADLKRALVVAEDLVKGVPELVQKSIDSSAGGMAKSLNRRWRRERGDVRKERARFVRHIGRRWGRSLDRLEFFIVLAREIAEERIGTPKGRVPGQADVLLLRLHARACQVAAEALVLLRHGFGDGAHARWRTLHEIAVVASYVAERGDAVAERYVAHVAVETRKGATQYQEFCRRLGERKLSKREMAAIEKEYTAVLARYGPSFKGDYGWAAESLGIPSPGFANIEKAVKVEHCRPLYRLAGHNVHANPKGALYRLGLPAELNDASLGIALIGPSDEGLAQAGTAVSWSLLLTAMALTRWDQTIDTLVIGKLLAAMDDQVAAEFTRAASP